MEGGDCCTGSPETVAGFWWNADSNDEETEETAAGLDKLSVEARGVDSFEGDTGSDEVDEDPTNRCLNPAGDISLMPGGGGLRPWTIRGGEESLGAAVGDGAKDTLGGVDICGEVDSTSGDEIIVGPASDVGDPEKAGAADTWGGVEDLVKETDVFAVATESCDWGGGLTAGSLTGEDISGRWAAGCSESWR